MDFQHAYVRGTYHGPAGQDSAQAYSPKKLHVASLTYYSNLKRPNVARRDRVVTRGPSQPRL